MRDFVASKVISETEHVSLAAAQYQLQTLDPGPCPGRTADYFKIVLDHVLIAGKLQVAGTLPTLFGTSFDRWFQMFGSHYTLPDLWQPFMSGGWVVVLGVLREQFATFPQGLLLMGGLTAFQLLLYLLALLGVLSVRKLPSSTTTWWIIVLVVTLLILILSPGQGGNERFRVPAQPFLVCLAGYGLAYEILPRNARSAVRGPVATVNENVPGE